MSEVEKFWCNWQMRQSPNSSTPLVTPSERSVCEIDVVGAEALAATIFAWECAASIVLPEKTNVSSSNESARQNAGRSWKPVKFRLLVNLLCRVYISKISQ